MVDASAQACSGANKTHWSIQSPSHQAHNAVSWSQCAHAPASSMIYDYPAWRSGGMDQCVQKSSGKCGQHPTLCFTQWVPEQRTARGGRAGVRGCTDTKPRRARPPVRRTTRAPGWTGAAGPARQGCEALRQGLFILGKRGAFLCRKRLPNRNSHGGTHEYRSTAPR